MRYNATSLSLARREGTDLVVAVAPPMPIAAVIAPLTVRTLPVELPPGLAPHHRKMTIEVVAPDGYAFASLPPDAEEDGGAFGKAKLTFKLSVDKRKVTIRRDVTLAQSRIEVADYQRWRRWLQKVDALMHRGLRLVRR